jgi:photosystem II stability/assembly factor-like uncharacterized protein
MRSWFKFRISLAFLLGLTACGQIRQISPPTEDVNPGVTSSTPLPVIVPAAPSPQLASLKMVDAENGWAWTSSGQLLRSSDGGQTWLDHSPEGQPWQEGFFALDAQTAWLSVFFKDSNLFGLLHTSDGGQTWEQLSPGPMNPNGQPGRFHFSDPQHGWAESADVGAGNIYYSLSATQDGGKTWAPIPAKPPSPEAGLPEGTLHLCNICEDGFYYDPARMIIISGDMGSMESQGSVRMQVTFNLGNTWQTLSLPLPQDSQGAIVSNSTVTFFEGGKGRLAVHLLKMDSQGKLIFQRLAFYATQDGGSSWSLLPGELDGIARDAQPTSLSLNDLLILCGNYLCASHDGAKTWKIPPSTLDFTQTDARVVRPPDFIDDTTGWVLVQEGQTTSLYKTIDGGLTWNRLAPTLVDSAPVSTILEPIRSTPTPQANPAFEPNRAPDLSFDPDLNAERIHFPLKATWVEINTSLAAGASKRYVLSAEGGQVMSVSVAEGPAFTVRVQGADGMALSDPRQSLPFWRGRLPSTQDYFVSVELQANGPITLRIGIAPLGQAGQSFEFSDPHYLVTLTYPDEFAPTDLQIPVNAKAVPLLTLAFIDPDFYSPATNLSEATLLLAASTDPVTVSTCTQPSTQVPETVTGQVTVNGSVFIRAEFSGAAAGNRYDQVAYRTAREGRCFELIFLVHSSDLGNYPAETVLAFDRAALQSKFEAVLDTFLAK